MELDRTECEPCGERLVSGWGPVQWGHLPAGAGQHPARMLQGCQPPSGRVGLSAASLTRDSGPHPPSGRWSWRPLCGAGAREPGLGWVNFLCCCAFGDGEPLPSHSSAVRHPAPRGRDLGPGPTGQKPRCGLGCVSPEAPGKSLAQVHSADGRIQVPDAIGLRPVCFRLSLEVTRRP